MSKGLEWMRMFKIASETSSKNTPKPDPEAVRRRRSVEDRMEQRRIINECNIGDCYE